MLGMTARLTIGRVLPEWPALFQRAFSGSGRHFIWPFAKQPVVAALEERAQRKASPRSLSVELRQRSAFIGGEMFSDDAGTTPQQYFFEAGILDTR